MAGIARFCAPTFTFVSTTAPTNSASYLAVQNLTRTHEGILARFGPENTDYGQKAEVGQRAQLQPL